VDRLRSLRASTPLMLAAGIAPAVYVVVSLVRGPHASGGVVGIEDYRSNRPLAIAVTLVVALSPHSTTLSERRLLATANGTKATIGGDSCPRRSPA
jgi:hypothetical protein